MTMNTLPRARNFAIAALATCLAGSVIHAQTPVPAQTAPTSQPKPIYPDAAAAPADIKAALAKADREHKRVILDFGGNWCGDCKALASYFHKAPNDDLLKNNFVLVEVNIGKFDQNLDIAKKYEVPLKLGVPALAVLDAKGNILLSQKHGEFESMRSLDPSALTKFLEQWKPNATSK